MQIKRPSQANSRALRGFALAAVLTSCAGVSMAADQIIDLSSGSESFIGTGPLLSGGDDVISFVNLGAGTYDFLLSISSQNILDLGATLNGQAADILGSGKFRFAGLEGTDASPFTLTITGTATSKSLYSGELSVTAAVPEPETYALMLAGLGVVGFVARRRRQSAV